MKQLSRTWIVTDTHLGHKAMVQYCGRPENHSDIILRNLKRNLRHGDILIHLGDFCIGNDEDWHEILFSELPKIKAILVRGNHDRKTDSWYLRHGWDMVCETFSNYYFGKYITFSHIPIQGIQNINIHGHFHNNGHRIKEPEIEKYYNPNLHKLLEIESNHYQPVLLESFIKNKNI